MPAYIRTQNIFDTKVNILMQTKKFKILETAQVLGLLWDPGLSISNIFSRKDDEMKALMCDSFFVR